MFLVRLIYVSEVDDGFTKTDIEQILTSARRLNTKLSVTGLLCFSNRYFLQCLEGGRSEVNQIYRNICQDARHKQVTLLDYKEAVAREFDTWSMGYMPESSLTFEMNLRYSGNSEFSPYQMSGESCHQMMLELSKTVPVI
jgi:hypothetical protein